MFIRIPPESEGLACEDPSDIAPPCPLSLCLQARRLQNLLEMALQRTPLLNRMHWASATPLPAASMPLMDADTREHETPQFPVRDALADLLAARALATTLLAQSGPPPEPAYTD